MTDTPHDVLVIGSGAAGLTAALALAETKKVLVLAKGRLDSGSTAWAQGGIAAVLDAGDTFDNHIRDTMVAGAGLNDRETVEFVIERAPASIDRLCELGVPFNREEDDLHLTREGGHSHRRIVHVNDATGWAVQAALLKAAEARRVRAEVKALLKMGSMTMPELLDRADTDPIVAKLKVLSALESLPKLGKVKARRTMEEIGISESRRLRGLGSQQRAELLARFG